MSDLLTRRNGFWHYVRRVPKSLAELDRRRIVFQSTKIRVADDPRGIRAAAAARAIDAETEAYWRGLQDGQAAESQRRYDALRKRARGFGFDYAPASEIAARPLDEILRRVEKLLDERAIGADHDAVAAVVGLEDRPRYTLSTLFETYEALSAASLVDMSDDQKRKWGNPKKRALANLIAVVGDKPIDQLTRGDAIDFQDWWSRRVVAGEVQIDTANKDIGSISAMLRAVDRRYRLGLPPVFRELRIAGAVIGQRTAFLPAFIRDRILAAGALDGLNDEARRIVYMMVETGMRPSEICNLTADTIMLGHAVPHVVVRSDGRRMKTPHSGRTIPLVGVALAAAKAQPAGFPRYRDGGATLSATVNKFLAENDLRPSEGHSLYSLRHAFEDRLTAVDAPDKMIAVLMGHKHQRPKYGLGPDLELKRRWLDAIAFKGPDRV